MTLVGNSFGSAPEDSAPCIRLSHQAIRFPPCRVREAAHTTLTVLNDGLTPVQLQVADVDVPSCFVFMPVATVIPPKGFCVMCARFEPTEAGSVRGDALLVLNNNWAAGYRISLTGTCCNIEVTTDAGSQLLCTPVCPGSKSTRRFHLYNAGRVPVAFTWACSSVKGAQFMIQPEAGVLRGATEMAMTCSFQPGQEGHFHTRAVCTLCSSPKVDGWAKQTVGVPTATIRSVMGSTQIGIRKLLSVRLQSSGTAAALSAEPHAIHLGPVQVGQRSVHKVTLSNNSNGRLELVVELQDSHGRMLHAFEPGTSASKNDTEIAILGLVKSLPARANKGLTLVLQPASKHAIAWTIVCRVIGSTGQAAGRTSEVRLHLQDAMRRRSLRQSFIVAGC
jgi:hypothetical protein